MESKRLQECLTADFTRLREVAGNADLSAAVPSCPDWTVADLVHHVGSVYLHKVECMRQGSSPQWPPPGLAGAEPLALLDRTYAELTAEFAARPPESPAHTWYEPDKTVRFWIRRMAQETVIHRVDAELGAGAPIAPIPIDLASDGIDEFLVGFVHYGSHTWPEDYADVLPAADGRTIRVESPDQAWFVRPTTEAVEVTLSDVDTAAAVVRGEPADLLLWLWKRGGEDRVTVTGDDTLVACLRRVLAAAAT